MNTFCWYFCPKVQKYGNFKNLYYFVDNAIEGFKVSRDFTLLGYGEPLATYIDVTSQVTVHRLQIQILSIEMTDRFLNYDSPNGFRITCICTCLCVCVPGVHDHNYNYSCICTCLHVHAINITGVSAPVRAPARWFLLLSVVWPYNPLLFHHSRRQGQLRYWVLTKTVHWLLPPQKVYR